MPKYCPECGGPLEERAKFCPNCGYRLSDAEIASQQAAAPTPAAPAEPQAPVFPAPAASGPQNPGFPQGPQTPASAPEQPMPAAPIGETVVLDQFRNQYEARQSYQQYNQQQNPQSQPCGWSPVPPQPQQSYGGQPQQRYGGPNYQGYSAASSVQAQPKKKSHTGLIVAIVAVVLAALGAVACFVWPGFLKKDSSAPQPSAPAPSESASLPTEPATEPSTEPVIDLPTTEPAPVVSGNPFDDVEDYDTNLENYLWAYRQGLITGSTVNAWDDVSLGEGLRLLWLSAGSPAPETSECPYTDVPEDADYRDAMLWALDIGLLKGTAGTELEPEEALTRAEAATFCYFMVPDDGSTLPRAYGDVTEDDWCYDAINWAFHAGVADRDYDLCFDPWDDIMRGDYLCFLSRVQAPELALEPEEPLAASLADYGLTPNVELGQTVEFSAWTQDGGSQPLTMTVERYGVMEPDEEHPAVDGYEWREVVLFLDYGNEEAANHSYSLMCDIVDTNYPLAYMQNKWYGDDSSTCFIYKDGAVMDVYEEDLEVEEPEGALFRVIQRMRVPKGYQGLVVAVYSKNSEETGDYLFDYCDNSTSAVFLLD